MKMRFLVALVALTAGSMPPLEAQSVRTTSEFGVRGDPFHGGRRSHNGIDIAAPMGSPVFATGDGWVTYGNWKGSYGYLVTIQHPSGHETRFAHLSRVLVAPGQAIRKGTVIGLVGSTGRSTGPHLHYEVRYRGAPLNPRNFM